MRVKLLLLLLVVETACGVASTPVGERFEGRSMGTTYEVRLGETVSESERIGVARAIEEALEDVNERMSNYLPDSEVSRFNRAEAGVPVRVSTETFEVVREASRVSALTGGAFDVTVAPLVGLWGFGAHASPRTNLPSEAEVSRARARVGYDQVVLDDDAIALTKKIDGLECDLSGIAKGYAVDRVAEALEARGHRDYMVEVGGEVRTSGKNPSDEAWHIGIERPTASAAGAREIERVVPLSGLSMATSGDYRNVYEIGGRRYSHLIDPRTGWPKDNDLESVSVIDETCMRADALASGLLVLGPEKGFELAVAKDLTVLFLVRTDEGGIVEKATPSFKDLFEPGVPPGGLQ
jgi:FAD:protein FMN transferase